MGWPDGGGPSALSGWPNALGGWPNVLKPISPNDSGSPLINYSVTGWATSSTNDSLVGYDAVSDGTFTIIPNPSGTFTKTLTKAGAGDSKVNSISRLGYARLSGNSTTGSKIKIGNANLNITKKHFLAMLVRINRASNIDSYSGKIPLLTTTQNDGSGNTHLQMWIGGATYATGSYQRKLCLTRSAIFTATPGSITGYYLATTGGGAWLAEPYHTTSPDDQWFWMFCRGSDTTISNPTHNNLAVVGATLGTDRITIGVAPVNNVPSRAGVGIREGTALLLYTATNYVNNSLTNIDLVISPSDGATSRTIDVARVIKLSEQPTLDHIGAICAGADPASLFTMAADDFVLDFGSLPSIATVTQGAVTFNPAEDGPVLPRFHGTNGALNTLNVTNRRIA